MSQKVVAQGGKGGKIWDDGISHGVKQITVGRDDYCVTYIKVKYAKDGISECQKHGVINQTPQQFEVNFPTEYITSVEGTYAYPYWNVITSLVFKTSRGRISPTFGNNKFVLANNGERLVGFHGRSKKALNALGAYFLSEGGETGDTWDIGPNNDVRKIYIGTDNACVTKVMFDNGYKGTVSYGTSKEELQEFLLDSDEYIVSVEGTYGKVYRFGCNIITSLAFTTSEGRTSLTFGAKKFLLQDNGRGLIGFHGRSGAALNTTGAYFAEKLLL